MERDLKVGDHIIYIDSKFVEHDALATRVWPGCGGGAVPGCNLVIVSGDESKDDPYGRQIERASSIVHKSTQPAGANCWEWPKN